MTSPGSQLGERAVAPGARPAEGRAWVVPNRNTTGLVAVLIGMWWAGVSQSNGAAYLLGFVLAAVAAVSLVHAWANLHGVQVVADAPRPVFAGEMRRVPLRLSTRRRRAHFAVRVTAREGGPAAEIPEVAAEGEVAAELQARAPRRGHFTVLAVRVESRYPIGFFTARQTLTLSVAHWVYPLPAGVRPLPVERTPARSAQDGARVEGDDFGGVRAWRPGESQRHIDWKAAARGQPLLIKQWTGEADQTALLDWAALGDLEPEARLSQLAQWVVQAERSGCRYALRLPGAPELRAARGEPHFHRCLRALALFPVDAPALGEGAVAG